MRRSLFPVDDELPTWLHTVLCFAVVSPFALPLIWWGATAIRSRHLEPVSGPEIGQYVFGPTALEGGAAVWGGWSLVTLGIAFMTLGARYSRAGADSRVMRMLPWLLIGVSILLGLPARHA